MPNLETTYMGIPLKNPLVAASSGLTGSLDKIMELKDAGIAAVVLKSIFEEQISGNIHQIINQGAGTTDYPEADYYISNYVRSHSLNSHTSLVSDVKKKTGIPLIASINCSSSSEWVSFAEELENAGADAIELNIFYLPLNRNETPDEVERRYLEIVRKVAQKIRIPLSVKIGSNFSNIIGIADKLKANGAKGLALFNRFYEPDINLEKLELKSSEVFSSPADLRTSLRWIGLVSSRVTNLDLAATTGIHDAAGVIKQLLAGARVAQLCSTLYLNGTKVIPVILNELKEFMRKWNFRSIGDFRGRLSYNNISDPMMYERSQFMKYYSDRS